VGLAHGNADLREGAIAELRRELQQAVATHAFSQYLFFGQWRRVRATAARRGLQIIGDIPVFVAMDSRMPGPPASL